MIDQNRIKGLSEAELMEQLKARKLSEAELIGQLLARNNNYLKINTLISEDYKKHGELELIANTNNEYKDLNRFANNLKIIERSNKVEDLSRLDNDKIITPEQQEEIERFLNDTSRVLTINSPYFLFKSTDVIMASIRRDVNSIGAITKVSASNGYLTLDIKEFAIQEAKRQKYIFREDTPYFLLQNVDLIRQSIESDIRTIDYVKEEYLTEELKALALKLALENNYVITIISNSYLKRNIDIVKKNIIENPQTIDYIDLADFSDEEQNELIKIVIDSEKDYVLNEKSPQVLKSNEIICFKSIDYDLSSVRYIDNMTIEAGNRIVDKLIEKKYVINDYTPEDFKFSPRLCLSSAKNNINSVIFFGNYIKYWIDLKHNIERNYKVGNEKDESDKKILIELRNYLIENDYYSLEQFLDISVTSITDEVVLNYYLKKQGVPIDSISEDGIKYSERIKDFLLSILNTPLKVSNAKKILKMISLKEWEKYKSENLAYYSNVFNRICDALEEKPNFIEAIRELELLMRIDNVLGEKKYALYNAFIEYHHIYHNPNIKDKVQMLQQQRDRISEYSALFIAKSKEDYIAEREKELESHFKKLFAIKVNNPIVKKKVVEVKQREMLKKLYAVGDLSLSEKLNEIKSEYLKFISSSDIEQSELSQIFDLFIISLINNKHSNVDELLVDKKPKRFDEYEKYEKVSKLINRLNNNNISYNGREVDAYRHLIAFDGQKYIYNGNRFSESELIEIKTYKDLKYIYGKIRSEILKIAKSIASFDNLTEEDIKEVIEECPFDDEFYEYSFDIFDNREFYQSLRSFNTILSKFESNRKLFLNDNIYNSLKGLIINEGLYQFCLLQVVGTDKLKEFPFDRIKTFISDVEMHDLIQKFGSIAGMFDLAELNIDNLDEILEVKKMFEYGNIKQICLLGKDVIKKIHNDSGYTFASASKRIDVACDLLSNAVSKNSSTVPYINGECGKYKYSMYDSTDETLLTAGIDTEACFRCSGHDNDFLHYCALDKNGFVIKLIDKEGNFIARASGFRNGNGVYINQLRTIYDKKSSASNSEKESIIELLNKLVTI